MIPVILDQRVQETESRTTADGHIIRTTNSQCNVTETNKKDAPDLPPPLTSVWCIEQSWILCSWGTLRYRAVTGPAVPSCFSRSYGSCASKASFLFDLLQWRILKTTKNHIHPNTVSQSCWITDPSGYIACGYPGRGRFPPSFFFFF